MRVNLLIAVFSFTLLTGCKTQVTTINKEKSKTETIAIPIKEYSILAVLWQQHAAEYRALTYQAFNTAKLQLDDILANKTKIEKPLAIVTDIDETVLNNSPYNGKLIERNEDYSETSWIAWGKEKKAKAVPGSLHFFQYAQDKNVEVFYLSNRLSVQTSETLENLKQLGFPFADENHILLRTDEGGKETRRKKIQRSHDIVMLIGDNLSDFSEVFDGQPTKVRNRKADSLKTYFGNKYIVLPNAMYGDWETKGILEGKYYWTNFQKDSIRHSKVINY
ncbi:MAG: 5'-nucleotidase, lipoprotein e(P4) family [Algibacter sp.]|uniref:5'-nucleotidase, lipoprotein e(P4) family n=1 Tax=Algibacter sp. TaxID=1872428 RepID=UPI00260266A9|nr:5'-nucleotidase, lipoprotein e(P4) family [Algibacter sp.]MDG1729450.1 5'-nucleotidase, lipoprotein e(P4) family [Algibacter sp.]MDG2178636.1 5'-nucleotidase, lipoprotein e(P4) family [Algibacter sp.]